MASMAKIVLCLSLTVYKYVHKPEIAFWWEKQGFYEDHGAEANWEANEKVLQAVLISRKHWPTKQVSGMIGVGKMMKILGDQETDAYPQWRELETASHVLACRDLDAIQTFNTSVEHLRDWMVQAKTDPAIVKLVMSELCQWKQ